MRDLKSQFGAMAAAQATQRARDAAGRRLAAAEPRWFVAQACAGDVRAQRILRAEGVEFYYPQVRALRPASKRNFSRDQRNKPAPLVPTLRPLWRGYYFLRLDLRDGGWRDVFERAGMIGVLSAHGDGWRVPRRLDAASIRRLEALRAAEIDGALPEELTPREIIFSAGEAAKISELSSVFAGHAVRVAADVWCTPFRALDEAQLVPVMITLFGHEVPKFVPLAALARSGA